VATTAAQMNSLSDRLDGLVDRITKEHNTELPQERRDADGDVELLAALDRRKVDLKTAHQMHEDAKAAYLLAKAAYKKNPAEMDIRYAEALKLAAQIESVLDFRKTDDSDKSTTDTKVDETKVTDKDEEKKDDADKGKTDDKAKTEPKADSDKEKAGKGDKAKSEKDGDAPTDPIMAAIAKLGEDCKKQHDETKDAIEALKAGQLKPELAALLNTLDEDTLRGILNRSGLTPIGVDLMTVIAAYTPEELRVMLANLAAVSGKAEKLRRLVPGGKDKTKK
jgi:hypothetical protein